MTMIASLIALGMVALAFECVGLAWLCFGLCGLLVKLVELPIN
jgi:hypothetical protein